jgi:ADP-heptose:LPS heptosyltransferase
MHAVDNFARELARLGVQVGRDRHLDFFIPDVARERVDALLLAEGIGPHDPLIVVNPGGTWPNKVWPPRHIGELLEILNAEMPQVRLAICGGPEDVAIAQESLAHADRARVALLAGRTSVKELGALLARADLVVSGDTGPLHIASAVGAQIVGLYGPNDPDRSGPVGAQHLVVVHREGLDCVPCYRTTCARGDNACMVRLSARRVADAVRHQMLNAQEQSDGRPLRTRLERASGFPRIEYGEVA